MPTHYTRGRKGWGATPCESLTEASERVYKLENRFAELKRLRISAADPSRTELASLPLTLSFLIWKVKLSLECFVWGRCVGAGVYIIQMEAFVCLKPVCILRQPWNFICAHALKYLQKLRESEGWEDFISSVSFPDFFGLSLIRVGLTEPWWVFPENWAAGQWKRLIKMRIPGSIKCSEGSGVGLGVQTPESTEKSPSPEWWHVIAVLEPGRQRQASAWGSRPISEE